MKRKSAPAQDLHLKMLGSVLKFMKGSGVTELVIRDAFEKSLATVGERRKGVSSENEVLRAGNENLSAELLRMWHRDGRYIDGDAKPKPLHLSEGRNSLAAIVHRIDPRADAEEVLRGMRAVKLIRRVSGGMYLPTAEAAIVSRLHPLATDHIAKLVIRLVSTVSRNLDPAGTSLPLIERHAYTPDLSWNERKAFAQFTRTQGMAYLESVDNWLQQRRTSRSGSRTRRYPTGISASVHLFAHLGDQSAYETAIASRPRRGATKAKVASSSQRKSRAPTREARA